jgi:protein-S-isoprenylcysteine O-methyltransferase Ste14
MITRMVVQTTIWLAAMGVILFVAAGDWGWPQGWAFLGEIAISSFAVSLWLARHDPALLAARLSAPVQRDQRPWDRIFMAVAALVFVGWLVLNALDARRFQWSLVPLWAQALGAVLIALCMTMVWQTFRFNTFAAPQVRIQKDREQRVITNGPYRIVRHPMYAGALLMFMGTPLLLGSWWACSLCQSPSLAWVFGRWAKNECCAVSCLDTTTTPGRSGSACFRASGEKTRLSVAKVC